MSKTEYSRILVKRSSQVGTVPTIPATSEIDNTWLNTDLLVGEMFINTVDDRIWYRSSTGITEIIGGSAETVTTLVDNADGTFTYVSEDATSTTIEGVLSQTINDSALNPVSADDGGFLVWDDANSEWNIEVISNEAPSTINTYSIGGRFSFNGDTWRGLSQTNGIQGTAHQQTVVARTYPFGTDLNSDLGIGGSGVHSNVRRFGHVMPHTCQLKSIEGVVYNGLGATQEIAFGVVNMRMVSGTMTAIDSRIVKADVTNGQPGELSLDLAVPMSLLKGDNLYYLMASENTASSTIYLETSVTMITETI